MKKYCGLVVAFLVVFVLPARATDVATIIQRSVVANQKDWAAAPEYSYLERDKTDDGTMTYRVFMLDGSPYQYLVQKNGQPLSPEEQQEQRQALEQAKIDRRNESPEQRQERISKYEKGRTRDHLMMDQLSVAFNFKLLGEQKIDGFEAYVLSAQPRPGYQPPNAQTRALTGMQGKLWIDKKTFQWVRVEAQVVHPVEVEGFLATVERGTRFELEKMPVDAGIWLPKHFAMRSKARIFFLFTRRQHEDETYWGYRKGNPFQGDGEGGRARQERERGPEGGRRMARRRN